MANGRSITERERGELERLCDRLKSGLPGAPEFNERCDELCLLMFADGLFHDKNQKGIKRILGTIDELRHGLRD
jgi:hypothetical protein